MLQSQVFQSFAQRSNRGVVKFISFGTLVGGGYGFYWHQMRRAQREQLYQRVENDITEWRPIELSGWSARNYPWYEKNAMKQWEYKLVKVLGYFKDERILVKREREGKEGYVVMAPFVTSRFNLDPDNDPAKQATSTIIVNLGWVPKENKNDIEMGPEPLGTTDFELTGNEYIDPNTGFCKDQSKVPEEEQVPLVEFVGLVRRGEEQNVFRRRVNWPNQGVYNFIDLFFFSRFLRIMNLQSASQAYIERIVPEYDEESESMYPIPATKDNYVKDLPTASQHAAYSVFYGLASVLSLATLLLRR